MYFRQLFEAVRLLGWIKNEELVHVGHGLFLFGGKKMSTRKGGSIKLEEVLKEAVERAKKLGNGDAKTAAAVGIGAIKYYDLLHHPTSNINFDWEKIFVLEGNSGPYLQYTVARINSVLAKSKKGPTLQGRTLQGVLQGVFNREEELVLRCLVHFPEVIQEAAQSFAPNLLCNYLYDLASKFNTFYARHKILPDRHLGGGRMPALSGVERDSSEVGKFRLALTAAVGQVLKTGLTLLGIQAPERM